MLAGNGGGFEVFFGGSLDLPRNNQWRTGFIDQNRVDFIDDTKVKRPLDNILNRVRHIVAQVVKTQLAVGAVGHVAGIVLALFSWRHAGLDQTNR